MAWQAISKKGGQDGKAGKEARGAIGRLLEAVQALMSRPAFLTALVDVVGAKTGSTAREALRIFTSAVPGPVPPLTPSKLPNLTPSNLCPLFFARRHRHFQLGSF